MFMVLNRKLESLYLFHRHFCLRRINLTVLCRTTLHRERRRAEKSMEIVQVRENEDTNWENGREALKKRGLWAREEQPSILDIKTSS